MAKKSREKEYHFSFRTVVRLVIFSAIVYSLITFISAKKFQPKSKYQPAILGSEISSSSAQLLLVKTLDSAYKILPKKSQEAITNFDKNPIVITVLEKYDYLKLESAGFPQKQIKDIKKAIINSIYKDMMQNIDSEKP